MKAEEHFNERLLVQFEPLLYKTLSKLNVRQSNANYDDYLQELRLKLLHLADRFDGDPFDEEDIGRFLAFSGKGLYRSLLDKFRKDKNITEEVPLNVNALALTFQGDSFLDLEYHIKAFITESKKLLTKGENDVFTFLLEASYSMQEIAEFLGISRKTVHVQKNKIRNKLSNLKYLLAESN